MIRDKKILRWICVWHENSHEAVSNMNRQLFLRSDAANTFCGIFPSLAISENIFKRSSRSSSNSLPGDEQEQWAFGGGVHSMLTWRTSKVDEIVEAPHATSITWRVVSSSRTSKLNLNHNWSSLGRNFSSRGSTRSGWWCKGEAHVNLAGNQIVTRKSLSANFRSAIWRRNRVEREE